MSKHTRRGLILLTGALLFPAAASAQQEQQQQKPPAGPAQPTELVFEREVFHYPTYARRNPFKPLVSAEEGPRFEQLRLMGIIQADDPSMSVAVVGTSTVEVSEDASQVTVGEGRAWYLKVGQSIGNIRIVEIRRDQVVVEVEEFGLTEQKIMQLQTRRQGGTP
jgi:hypothetical protein